MNGYVRDVIDNETKINSDVFIVSIVGNIYSEQDIEFVARGFAQFTSKKSTS